MMSNLFLIFFSTILICHAVEITATENCTAVRDEFARAISEFTSCSINYSRPITLCEDCLNAYINMSNSYQNLSEVTSNGSKCLDHFVNLDRLQIVQTQHSNNINLWTRAKCYECYLVKNGTQTQDESYEFTQFKTYYGNFNSCTMNTEPINLCPHCMDDYLTLNDYYSSISNANERIGLCMDLVDLMNTTWTYWSEKCCKYRRHNEYIFIGTTVGVFIITILFYIIIQFWGEKGAPMIIQQTRFAESINNLRNT